nr:MAG TPA: hypothetical protein [Caudoviricetes sp.]
MKRANISICGLYLKPQNGLLSELLFRRRQSIYYQTVLFIYVALFISYEEKCNRSRCKRT